MPSAGSPGSPVEPSDESVTVLFTDIEGSTRRWEEQPAAMRAALVEHDRLLVRAVSDQDGRVLKHTGDGLIAILGSPAAATMAAVSIQRAMAAADWSDVGGLRVRVAIHRGPVQERDGDVFGPTMNRASRVMSAAHGGQVLLTDDAKRGLDGLAGVRLRDIGVHRLKDLSKPERLWQLGADGLNGEFPPARSLNASLTNLPASMTPLVGRTAEVAEITEALADGRLVTLVGPGGVGKTRIAIDVGRRSTPVFPDGVWFTDLTVIEDDAFVAEAIGALLSLRARAGENLTDTLADALGARRLLLVLDNCEHVLDGIAALLARVVTTDAPFRVLATSREPLTLPGEHRIRVPPLPIPDLATGRRVAPAVLGQLASVQLFTERAREARPEFRLDASSAPAVAEICARLDGIPLALELAAARMAVLDVTELAARLNQQLALFDRTKIRGVAGRQRTLQATLDWGYKLLDSDQRRVFTQLSTFEGEFARDDAAVVTDQPIDVLLPILSELLAKSMVTIDGAGLGRYRLLEPIRQYGCAQLIARGDESVRRRHADHYLARAKGTGPAQTASDEQARLAGLQSDLGNLRAAYHWMLEHEPSSALQLAVALYGFWINRGLIEEGLQRITEALAHTSEPEPLLHAAALGDAANLAWFAGAADLAERYAEEAMQVAEHVGHPPPPSALVRLAQVRASQGRADVAISLCDEARALAASIGDQDQLNELLAAVGAVLAFAGEIERGVAVCEDAVRFAKMMGPGRQAASLVNLGLALQRLDAERAAEACDLGAELAERAGVPFVEAFGHYGSGLARYRLGDMRAARDSLARALPKLLSAGGRSEAVNALELIAGLIEEGAPTEAACALGTAATLRERAGTNLTPAPRRQQAKSAELAERLRSALGTDSFAMAWALGSRRTIDDAAEVLVDAVTNLEPSMAATHGYNLPD